MIIEQEKETGNNRKGICEKCGKEAAIEIPYGPHKFCREHFNRFFEHRIRKNIRQNRLVKYGEKIAVGVSGGKDSMVTLHILNELFGKTGQNRIEAIMVNEGIEHYRESAINLAKEYCEEHNIPYHIVGFKEKLGIDLEDIAGKIGANAKIGSSCSFCGTFRRQLLNQKALEIGANKIATGHNLDDECQSIAMSFFGNDSARLSRLGEKADGMKKIGKFVPRIKPLYDTPETEIISYAEMNGIKNHGRGCCPYSWMAKRNHYRKMLNDLEQALPGTKYSLLASFKKLKPAIESTEKSEGNKVVECEICGGPSNSIVCGTCNKMQKLFETKKTGKIKAPINPLSCADTKGYHRAKN